MSTLVLFLVLLSAAAGLAGVAVARLVRSSAPGTTADSADLAHLARWTSRWRWAGVAVGSLLAIWAASADSGALGLGRLAMAAPALCGIVILAATVIGEVSARPARTATRSASLSARRVKDTLPQPRSWIVAAGLGSLVATLVVGTLTASPDDQGRRGRALVATCLQNLPELGEVRVTTSSTPWPGSFYALPSAVLIALALGLTVVGVVTIRDRANPDATHSDVDLRLRAVATRKVVSALGATCYGTLGPTLLTMATVLSNADCINGNKVVTGMLVILGLACVLLAVIMLANVLLPDREPAVAHASHRSIDTLGTGS